MISQIKLNTIMQSIRKSVRSISELTRPIQTLLVDYCDNSNIHGVRYLTERFLHWSERLWWIIALFVSLWFCGSAAHNIWTEWRANPMTLSYSEPSVPISEIPLPTITICPEVKSEKRVFDLTGALKSFPNITEVQKLAVRVLAQVCPNFPKGIDLKDDFEFQRKAFYEVLRLIPPEYKTTITKKDLIYDYATVVPVFTEVGLCFAYNSLNSHDIYTDDMVPELMIVNENRNASNWNLEKDIQDKSTKGRYPLHDVRSPPFTVFSVDLRVFKEDIDYQCNNGDQGFKVIFSTPGDALQFSDNSYQMRHEEMVQIYINPKLTITSEGLHKYDPHQRQCFLDSERRLRFFKIYSQSNCEAECLANFTQSECGCVKFSQPRDKSTKLCGTAKIKCYKKAEQMISSGDTNTKSFRDKCDCLPACTSIEYGIDIQQRKVNVETVEKEIISWDPNYKSISVRFAHIRIYFRDEQVNIVKRIESNTVFDFMSFCGGLLGIYMGVSALSVVEIVYYLTLRLYWIIRPFNSTNILTTFQQKISDILNRFRLIRGIRAFIVEFCDNSNIHGVVYFTRRGLHWTERLWWVIAFGLSLWMCTTTINSVWQGWQENPVKITFGLNERSISDVPFPTVTICPNVKSVRQKLDISHLLFNLSNLTNAIRSLRLNKNFRSVLHLCKYLQLEIAERDLQQFPRIADNDIYDILQDIAPKFDEVMHKCIWQGEVVNCSKYMAPILTSEGLCFAFNALNSHELYTEEMTREMKIVKTSANITNWNMEKGYEAGINQNDYPLRISHSGRANALEISLDISEKDFDFSCNSHEQAVLVTVSPLDGALRNLVKSFRVTYLEEAVITVKPKLTTTSEGLRKYNPNKRKCFFDSERKLRFFETYTQYNCEEECLANFTKEVCGCVEFSQPRDESIPVCGAGKIMCSNNARTGLLLHLNSDMQREQKYLESCNCLPSCTTIEYNAEIDRVQFNQSAIAVTAGRNANMSGIQRVKLVIYFDDDVFDVEQRVELYTFVDLFSLCGGLLGLFMGVSVLSIAEILYFSSLRWYWILRRPTSQPN